MTRNRIANAYRFLAFTIFNTIVALVLLNLVLAGLFSLSGMVRSETRSVDRRVGGYRERFADPEAYTRISAQTANQYLDEQGEMGSVGFQYAPWVQFRNPEFRGVLLNTDSHGFRRTTEPQHRDGKPLKIYVFGGSTTFGYGVPDEHTIPSYMQAVLEEKYPDRPILVRNYGQGFYYSSQEMLLLLSIIKAGDAPDFVVFVDGGNDTSQLAPKRDEPVFTPAMTQLWDSRRGVSSSNARRDWSWLPMVRLATGLSARLFPGSASDNSGQPRHEPIKSDGDLTEEATNSMIDYVVSRYTNNIRIIRAICTEYGIQSCFVWQPHPGYKYDRTLHKTFPFAGAVPRYWPGVYSRMEGYTSDDFLYLGDMLHDVSEKVFVDDVHYNETLNERIASRICERLHLDRNTPRSHPAASSDVLRQESGG